MRRLKAEVDSISEIEVVKQPARRGYTNYITYRAVTPVPIDLRMQQGTLDSAVLKGRSLDPL